jgi:hypothetical protein
MRHHCFVVVGYPEKAPDGTKSYNSAVFVNPDGEPVSNYRKYFLDEVDATWASKDQGFSHGRVAGLGCLALGLCSFHQDPAHCEVLKLMTYFLSHGHKVGAEFPCKTLAAFEN